MGLEISATVAVIKRLIIYAMKNFFVPQKLQISIASLSAGGNLITD